MKMSKHVGVQIIYCCDIYCCDINCAFVSYCKNVAVNLIKINGYKIIDSAVLIRKTINTHRLKKIFLFHQQMRYIFVW